MHDLKLKDTSRHDSFQLPEHHVIMTVVLISVPFPLPCQQELTN